jgi:hypothetical protein
VTGAARGFADKGGGTTDEGTITGSSDDDEGLTTFDGGGGITVVTLMLIDGKRFTSNGRLIDLDESVFRDDTTIGRDNGTFFDLDNITGNDFGGFQFAEGTVSEGDRFQSEGLLQFLDYGTSLEFLNETDTSVKQQQGADDAKIYPILKTGGKNGGSLM